MAKDSVADWSTTDTLNTDIGGTNIAEGCAPSGINDAIRKVMAQIAAWAATLLTSSTAAATYLPLAGGALTGGLTGTTATFSGAMTAASGLTSLSDLVAAGSGGGNAILSGSGDITTSRSGGTTGAVYFGSSASVYLFFTGTWFSFTGGGVKLATNQQIELGGASVRFNGSKLLLAVGATDIASLDGSGNLRVLGNVTANAGSL